ncbi:hypothetical protein [Candidatus Vallotia tarda]|uniref:hypothetical protein n=1 Tax=Candidatus Vallotiella hemipterorum TaxID=1177213 RepID=UPI001C1FF235|nr:hypothetical protein [Candidatus Vallotia tarda]
MAMQGQLNNSDSVLWLGLRCPLWIVLVSISGGRDRYPYDEYSGWLLDMDGMKTQISLSTRFLIISNSNHLTRLQHSDDPLPPIPEPARQQHQLAACSDNIYDKIIYDGGIHTAADALLKDQIIDILYSLFKNYKSCGYQAGWMAWSSNRGHAIIRASPRLHENVLEQYATQTALGGYRGINDLIRSGGGYYITSASSP